MENLFVTSSVLACNYNMLEIVVLLLVVTKITQHDCSVLLKHSNKCLEGKIQIEILSSYHMHVGIQNSKETPLTSL